MKHAILISIFCFSFLSYSCPPPLDITDTHNSWQLLSHISYYEDTIRGIHFQDILIKNTLFTKNKKNQLQFGFTKSGYWFRFCLHNKTTQTKKLILSLKNPDINVVRYYELKKGKLTKIFHTGESEDFSKRDMEHRNFSFTIELEPDDIGTYYLYCYNNGDALFIPLVLEENSFFIKNDSNNLMFNGLYFGLCLFIILFNFFLLLTIKGRVYLFYTLYVLFNSLFLFNLNGFSSQYLWTEFPWWAVHSIILFACLSALFLLLFIRNFFNTFLQNKKTTWFIIVLMILSGFNILLTFFNYPVFLFATKLSVFTVQLSVIIAFVVSIRGVINRHHSGIYFLSAVSCIFAGTVVYFLRDMDILPENMITDNALRMGILLEMLILSFAVVDRFRIEQKEARNLLYEQKNEIEEKKTELEKEISERIIAEKNKEKLEVKLRHSQRMETIGRLAGGIAHDFNNILTPVIGYTEMALEDLPDDNPLKSDLSHVLKGAIRAKELVKQILLSSLKMGYQKVPVYPHVIANEVISLIKSAIPPSVNIKRYIDSQSGIIMADPTQIHQVFMNLCTNAYQAMKDQGGQMEVRVEPLYISSHEEIPNTNLVPGDYVSITVSDTGCGMSKEIMERIFDPFFTTKPVGEGTGLGLSVVHGIVTSSGGDISVSSESGKGSLFRIFFPKVKEEKKQQTIEDDPIPMGNETLMIVDDDMEIGIMLRKKLEKLGYTVEVYTQPGEAVEKFRTSPDKYDIVISDFIMPNVTGDKLAEQILSYKADAKIVIMSGFGLSLNEIKEKKINIMGYIQKPINFSNFCITIRNIIDNKIKT